MKSGGAGYSKQGPGCADCTKFLNNKRLPEKGSGAFDGFGAPPEEDGSAGSGI